MKELDGLETGDAGIVQFWTESCDGEDWIYSQDHWYHWIGTHWQPESPFEAIEQAFKRLGDLERSDKGRKPRDTRLIRSRIDAVRSYAEMKRTIPNELNSANVLNVSNGTVDLNSGELRPHAKTDYCTYLLDYPFDPEAQCPTWDAFLASSLPDGDTIAFVHEFVGYSLTNDVRFEKMAWLYGKAGSGKSTLLNLVQSLVGGNHYLPVDLAILGTRGDFYIGDIAGKRVLACAESQGRINEEKVKQLVSGDAMTVQRKYRDPFTVRSQAKIWFAMNEPPHVTDFSGALWRRICVVPFLKAVAVPDVDLAHKLKAERSGILNKALQGLCRLHERGHFAQSGYMNDALHDIEAQSDALIDFLPELRQMAQKNDKGHVLAREAHRQYCEYAKREGKEVLTESTFGRRMKNHCQHKMINGRRVYLPA